MDSRVLIDYPGSVPGTHPEWLDRELNRTRIGLTDLILCEVLPGIREEAIFKQVRRTLLQFAEVESGGEDLAVASAQNYRFLRARGIAVRNTIVWLIATVCLHDGHTLLHRDRDCDPFEQHLDLSVLDRTDF